MAATSSSALAVAIGASGACSISGGTVTITSGSGTCTVTFDQAGNANYAAAPQITQSTTAQPPAPVAQTITVTQAAPASAVFGESFAVAATASSGLSVTIGASGACSIDGGTVTMTSGTGTCTVTFNQAGSAAYLAAPQVTQTTTGQKASQTITVNPGAPATAVYNTTFGVAATASSGLLVTIGASGACSINAGTVTMTSGTGTCTVTFDQAGDANYLAATQISQATTAQKAAQTITVTQGAPATAAQGTTFPVSATASSSLTVSIGVSGACSISGGTVTLTGGSGTCTVTFSQAGSANYAAAPQVIETTNVQAAFAGAWWSAASMTAGRNAHTATLLTDGRVLVTGGLRVVGGQYAGGNSVEIYSAATNSWATAPSMSIARARHTATLLNNGRVLVTGGCTPSSCNAAYLADVEIYDPRLEQWFAAPPMNQPRTNHQATPLLDGRVLVTGGYNNTGEVFDSLIYDPLANAWTSVTSSPIGGEAKAVRLLDGRVLLLGVWGNAQASYSGAIYDPAVNTWTPASRSPAARRAGYVAGTLLRDGRAFVTGDGIRPEVYDPSTNSWSYTPAAPLFLEENYLPSSTLLPDGRVLVFGGLVLFGPDFVVDTAYIYDGTTSTWSTSPAMTDGRLLPTVTTLPDGRVLVVGGEGAAYNLASAEIFSLNEVVGVAVTPSTVAGGKPSKVGVFLTNPAPAGGAVVGVAADAPASFLFTSTGVGAGKTHKSFTVRTAPVAEPTVATIYATYGGVTATVTLTVMPPRPYKLAFAPASPIGGVQVKGTVTLDGKAPAGGVTVALASSSAAAGVPETVTVPEGASVATFAVTTVPVEAATPVDITASAHGGTITARITVTPPALSKVTLGATSVVGGVSVATNTVTLTGAAPASGVLVSLATSNAAATPVPAAVLVPAGATSATFAVNTVPVAASVTVTISGTAAGVTKTDTFAVNAPAVVTVALAPASVKGGTSSTATIMLAGPAPPGGIVVTLRSSNTAAATVPASITVPAGARLATAAVTTKPVGAAATVTISATGGGSTKSAKLTVTP